jgi:hypothetical protein
MKQAVGMPPGRAVATLAGAIIGSGLMCGIAYTHGSDLVLGALAGAVLIGALGYGVEAGTMSVVTLSAVLFGLFFCMIGPGCDDFGGTAVLPAALFGAAIGWLIHNHCTASANPWAVGEADLLHREQCKPRFIIDPDRLSRDDA